MPETEHGIIYPESTDHTRLWEHFQNLAESVDVLLATMPAIQHGSATVSIANAGAKDQAVTFAQPFTTPPRVVVSWTNRAAPWIVGLYQRATTTGFTITVVHKDVGSTGTATVQVDWIAVAGGGA